MAEIAGALPLTRVWPVARRGWPVARSDEGRAWISVRVWTPCSCFLVANSFRGRFLACTPSISFASLFSFFASMTAAAKLPAHVAAQASRSSPNLVREIFYGLGLGIFGGAFWKIHHLNERRKTEEFYARLEAGEITVQATEE